MGSRRSLKRRSQRFGRDRERLALLASPERRPRWSERHAGWVALASLAALLTAIPTAVLARSQVWSLLDVARGWSAIEVYVAFHALPFAAAVVALLATSRGGPVGGLLGPIVGWAGIVWLVAFWPAKNQDVASSLRSSLGGSGIDPDLADLLVTSAISTPLVVLASTVASAIIVPSLARRPGPARPTATVAIAILTGAGVLSAWAALLWVIAGP